MQWTVERLVEATGGRLISGSPEAPVSRICTDSRSLQPGDAFLALVGENHDGHGFIGDVALRKAAAVVVQQERIKITVPSDIAVVAVPDTLYALGELARYWRRQFSIPVVGITGSNGKTSTKEMIAGILSRKARVLKNQGNFNNLIGAPLTLLSLEPDHQAAVVEMGINVPGEMARLAEICRPTAGLITNIHTAHLEGLESLDRVLEEKGRLWLALNSEGLAVVNGDDDGLVHFSRSLKARKITYSLSDPGADVRVVGEVRTDGSGSEFRLGFGDVVHPVRLNVLGLHQVQNAVAAAAAAYGLSESPEEIVSALSLHRPVNMRMQVQHLEDGTTIVNDTYNANPVSMLAAVRAVAAARGESPFVAVLGEMRELGPGSAGLHREVGRQIGELGVDGLITLGNLAYEISKGAQDAGIAPKACYHAKSHDDAVDRLLSRWVKGAWILVKGSRGMTMERVVKGILEKDSRGLPG